MELFRSSSTAALVIGTNTTKTAATESWDGSSWTEVNDLATARYQDLVQEQEHTLALMAGGMVPS